MAQGDYREDELFSTAPNEVEDLDIAFNINNADDLEEVTLATEKDKAQAKKTGTAKAPVKEEKKPEPKAEDEIPVIGDELEDTDEDQGPESKKADKDDKSEPAAELTEYAQLSEGLFKSGIWNRDEDEDPDFYPESEEDFIERWNYESQKMANGYVSQLAGRYGEEAQQLFDAVFINGVPVKDYVSKWQESQDFKSMDMQDESNQERVVRAFLEQQGVPDNKITDKIKKLKMSEDLEDEANTYHSALVKKQEDEMKKIEEDSRKRIELKKQADAQYSSGIRTILNEKARLQDFDGIPVNRVSADQAVDMLDTKKWKLPSGELVTDWDVIQMELNNPQNWEVKAKLALLFNKYEKGKPLSLKLDSVVKRKETTQAKDKFFNIGKPKSKTAPVSSKKENTVAIFDDL